MQLQASWLIVGVVTERRVLTSEKSKTWRGYVVKVASLGATFELQATPEQHGSIQEGQVLRLTGRFEDQHGRVKLVISQYADASERKGAA